MAVTLIREIRNNAGVPAAVRNMEEPGDTADGRGDFQPGESRRMAIELAVPWCGDLEKGDFHRRHIQVDVGGRRFAIWQASHDLTDRVRVSTDGQWHKPGDEIGAFAAVGVLEEFAGGRERVLVINDFSLWLLPLGFSLELEKMVSRSREEGYRLCGPLVDRPIASVPKKSATAFSMAGPASDAFDRKQPGARFLYRDSGKRYEFQIREGVVQFQPPVLGHSRIDRAVSFRVKRVGEETAAPRFDLIAASGGRIFAKEQGWDRFYFAIVDEGYVHAGRQGAEFIVLGSSLTLDPEFNQPGAKPGELVAPLRSEFEDFGGHPAAERWPAYRLALNYGVLAAMLVRIRRFTWHLLDTRLPLGGESNEFFAMLKKFAVSHPLEVMALAGITGVAGLPIPQTPPAEAPGAPPPMWAPTYNHVLYCPNAPHPQVQRQSIDYQRVLDIGVGHVHHHEQYEGVTGGEIQPFFIGRDNPNWLLDAAAHYRFMFGPIRDGDGYIDGTCNFYVLAQLKPDNQIQAAESDLLARRSAYAALWMDEQTFFTQRWHLVHPDDHQGVMISIVERLHTDPARYQWRPELFWCPFRTGFVGPRSRMAVAAQVILVTGEDPETKAALLFSINFSFGTIDRSWRWRTLPAPARYFDGQSLWSPPAATLTGEEQVPDGPDPCVYPQTVRLREDMTICIQGRGPGREGRTEIGCWYQRYLPATNALVPAPEHLAPGQEPGDCARIRTEIGQQNARLEELADLAAGLDPRNPGDRQQIAEINWQREAIRAQIDTFQREAARLGCSPNTPGARPKQGYAHAWKFLPKPVFELADRFSHLGVYSPVDSRMQYYVVTPEPGAEAALDAGQAGGWIDDGGQLAVEAYSFRFDWMRIPWPLTVPPPLRPKPNPSLFNPDIRLRIVRRGAQWIAMHWDKRDDDLMPFTGLPRRVRLKFRRGPELKEGAGSLPDVLVTLQPNRWVAGPPVVPGAYFWWEAGGAAVLAFATPKRGPDLPHENVWRVRMAALDPSRAGGVVSLLDVVTQGSFTRTPTGGLLEPVAHDFYEYRWTPPAGSLADLQRYCSPAGAVTFGTSIWFEDLVGHVSVPEHVRWQRSPTLRAAATPRAIPLGPRVAITVQAEDARTSTRLAGQVKVDGQVVGQTHTSIPFTFTMRRERVYDPDLQRWIFKEVFPSVSVSVPDYPDVVVPVDFYTPTLRVWVEPALILIGRPTRVTVYAEDAGTRAPAAGRVKLNGQDVAATGVPFDYTFAASPPAGVVSAAGYPEQAIAWPPLRSPQLAVSIQPHPVPLGTQATFTVRAEEVNTRTLVDGAVSVNGQEVARTNVPFSYKFVMLRVRVFDPEIKKWVFQQTPPVMTVNAPSYSEVLVDLGLFATA